MQDSLVDLIVSENYRNEFEKDKDDANLVIKYYQEVPEEWLTSDINDFDCVANSCMTVKFAYSDKEKWNYDLLWRTSRYMNSPGLFLHPVISGFSNGEKVIERHAAEDYEGEWINPRFERSIMNACNDVVEEIDLFGY